MDKDLRDFDFDAYIAWLKTRCQSMCDGCICLLEPDHADEHICEAENSRTGEICGFQWRDEDAKRFMDEMRKIGE